VKWEKWRGEVGPPASYSWALEDIKDLAHNINDHDRSSMVCKLLDIAKIVDKTLEKDKTL
jgi:hypothetical protein